MAMEGVQQINMDVFIAERIREYFMESPPWLMMVSNWVLGGNNLTLSDFNEITTAGFERRLLDTWAPVDTDSLSAFTDSNEVTNTNLESFNISVQGWVILDGVDTTRILGWWTQITEPDTFGPGAKWIQMIRWRNASKSVNPF